MTPGERKEADETGRPRLALRFAWYDLWVGAFYDRAKRTLYVCPLPCLLVVIRRG